MNHAKLYSISNLLEVLERLPSRQKTWISASNGLGEYPAVGLQTTTKTSLKSLQYTQKTVECEIYAYCCLNGENKFTDLWVFRSNKPDVDGIENSLFTEHTLHREQNKNVRNNTHLFSAISMKYCTLAEQLLACSSRDLPNALKKRKCLNDLLSKMTTKQFLNTP